MFVVGHAGDWTRAAQVLFEPSCLQRHPPSRRKAGQGHPAGSQEGSGDGRVAGTLCASGAGLDRPSASGNQLDYCVVDKPSYAAEVVGALTAGDAKQLPSTIEGKLIAGRPTYAVRTAQTGANGIGIAEDSAHTLDSAGVQAVAVERERERETVACETAGALLSRDGKGMSSTIDGKLIAVRVKEANNGNAKKANSS